MAGNPDDERTGELLKLLRRRSRLRQQDLATAAGVSRRTEARIEHGDAGAVTLNTVRAAFEPLGARVRVTVIWHGAAADRLLDSRHAALVERAIKLLHSRHWETAVEVTFSEYGERGSIDLLGGHAPTRSVLVGEVKASLGSLEETNRMLDIKARLAHGLARSRFGWAPEAVSRLLILPDDRTVRRIVERHSLTLGTAYPARGRDVRAWLRHPIGPVSGILFLLEGHHDAMDRG